MANSKQATKRARQNDVRAKHNASIRSALRTKIKNVLKAVLAKDTKSAQDAYQKASQYLDRSAGKHLVHQNRAARLKSRLNAKVKALVKA